MTKVQRYKVGYYTDEWGMSSNTPCLVPDDSGFAVKFEDYCKLETELAAIKAENESLKLDAERWRKIEQQWSSAEIRNNLDGSFKSMTITFEAPQLSDELTMEKLRRDFDAAMAQGEQGC